MHAHLPSFGRTANGATARGMKCVSGIKRLSGNPLCYNYLNAVGWKCLLICVKLTCLLGQGNDVTVIFQL